MAIYRAESGRRIAIVGIVAVVVGLVVGLAIGRLTAPSFGDQLAAVRVQTDQMLTSLEIIRTEYAKVLEAGPDQGGAQVAATRLQTQFEAVKPALVLIDPFAADEIAERLADLKDRMARLQPDFDVITAADAVQSAIYDILPQVPVPSGN